ALPRALRRGPGGGLARRVEPAGRHPRDRHALGGEGAVRAGAAPAQEDAGHRSMSTFALVHGGLHGAWCWERLVPELEGRGHRAVAMDLPIDDDTAGAERYAEAVVNALDGVDDDVVVVGHSLGGLTIPLVAERRPVARLVFLCATLPDPGRSFVDQTQQDPGMLDPRFGGLSVGDDRTADMEALAGDAFYNDCPPDEVAWAVARFRRQAWLPMTEVSQLQAWPDVER